jgi:hypothetical protein
MKCSATSSIKALKYTIIARRVVIIFAPSSC